MHWITVNQEGDGDWSSELKAWTAAGPGTRIPVEHIQSIRPYRTVYGTEGSEVMVLGKAYYCMDSPTTIENAT